MITYALIHACCFFFCVGFLMKKTEYFNLGFFAISLHVIIYILFAPFTASVVYGYNFYSAD